MQLEEQQRLKQEADAAEKSELAMIAEQQELDEAMAREEARYLQEIENQIFFQQENQCGLCQVYLFDKQTIVLSPCSHVYHMACV